jgi:hypothetical protein
MTHHLQSDNKTITVTLPNQNTTNLVVSSQTTVGQIVSILVKTLPDPPEDGEQYGITLHESPLIIFEKHTKIAKIPTVSFVFYSKCIFSFLIC